jgi:hypothetical protein
MATSPISGRTPPAEGASSFSSNTEQVSMVVRAGIAFCPLDRSGEAEPPTRSRSVSAWGPGRVGSLSVVRAKSGSPRA